MSRSVVPVVAWLLCMAPAAAFAQEEPPPPPPPEEAPAEPAVATPDPGPTTQPPNEETSGGTVDMRGAMKRYDFDQGAQYAWGAVGGVVGSLGLGAAGVGAGVLLCADRGPECGSAIGLLALMGWSTGLIAGSMVAVNLAGGDRADGITQLASFGGVFLGVLAAGAIFSLIPPDTLGDAGTPQFVAAALGFGAVVGGLAGAGSAFGYQAVYPEGKPWQVNLAPMILPEGGGGLVLGGRF